MVSKKGGCEERVTEVGGWGPLEREPIRVGATKRSKGKRHGTPFIVGGFHSGTPHPIYPKELL